MNRYKIDICYWDPPISGELTRTLKARNIFLAIAEVLKFVANNSFIQSIIIQKL